VDRRWMWLSAIKPDGKSLRCKQFRCFAACMRPMRTDRNRSSNSGSPWRSWPSAHAAEAERVGMFGGSVAGISGFDAKVPRR
jgi:hypothetical protein